MFFIFGFCVSVILIIFQYNSTYSTNLEDFKFINIANDTLIIINSSEENTTSTCIKESYLKSSFEASIESILSLLPNFRDQIPTCVPLFNFTLGGFKRITLNEETVQAKKWKFDEDLFKKHLFSDSINNTQKRCTNVKEKLAFHTVPLSDEERDFPLAYSLLVYNDPVQVILAIYQPQNAYCIAIDGKSRDEFKAEMWMLTSCFNNIYEVDKVEWYTYSVVNGVWKCIDFLAKLEHNWKYYQYLSGVDLPLKTNLEMVRIFKQMNGSINTDVVPIPEYRTVKAPLQLWKSSLSGLLSREGVSEMVSSEEVRRLLIFLKRIECPDEALWATIFGNSKMFNISGNFDAKAFYRKLFKEQKVSKMRCTRQQLEEFDKERIWPEEPFVLYEYYISRYQVWDFIPYAKCGGWFSDALQ